MASRRLGERVDALWLLEHEPTITFGTGGGADHLRVERNALERRGFSVVATRRGGDVTCHEPGQLVGYPIVALGSGRGPEDRDLHAYLRAIERALIELLADYSIDATTIEGRTGVWIARATPPRKIAAIGVQCSSGWVTSHGFALNVDNRLEGFRSIVPCGISDAAVTRLADELPSGHSAIDWDALALRTHAALESTLGRPLELLNAFESADLVPCSLRIPPAAPSAPSTIRRAALRIRSLPVSSLPKKSFRPTDGSSARYLRR